MAKTKESTAEALAEDLNRLRGLHEEAKARIAGLERELGLLQERDAECARRGFQGEDVRRERTKLQETLDSKGRELAREVADISILEAELTRVEVEHARVATEEERAAIPREGAALHTDVTAVVDTLRELLQEPAQRVRQCEERAAALSRRHEVLHKVGYTAAPGLATLGHALRQLRAVLDEIGGTR